uniref:Uncharacterized protein n=1 Tax=Lepeophtheirus salmonis TaxID=72036 RepID=A0A0K2TM69_LEPSM
MECLGIGELLIVDYSLSIPSNTQQHLLGSQSWLGYVLDSFVGFQPRSLLLDIDVRDPFFITIHNMLQL